MNLKFHHVALAVNSLQESISWYKDKLGFAVISQYSKGTEIALLELSSIRLELFQAVKGKPLPDYSQDVMQDLQVVGTKHLCLQTGNLDEAVRDLKQKGVEFVTEMDTTFYGGRYIFFKDCNGILIELFQYSTLKVA